MKNGIRSITIISQTENFEFIEGIDDVYKIIDRTVETESGITTIYDIEDYHGKIYKRIENCPVLIKYW